MPIPGIAPSAPAGAATSSDGFVTVTVDPATASTFVLTDFGSLPAAASAWTVTVTRAASSSSAPVVVRGFDTRFAPRGIAIGVDHEAPLGVSLTYVATVSDIAGNVVATSAPATVLAIPPVDGVAWLKSLRTPAVSQRLLVATLPDWTRPIPLGLLTPLSSAYPAVAAGVRSAKVGTLSVHTPAKADRIGLDRLLSTPGPYLVQFSPATDEPDRYVVVGEQSTTRWTRLAAEQGRTHALPLTEVVRPTTTGSKVATPGRTWADAKRGHTLGSVPGRIVDFVGFAS